MMTTRSKHGARLGDFAEVVRMGGVWLVNYHYFLNPKHSRRVILCSLQFGGHREVDVRVVVWTNPSEPYVAHNPHSRSGLPGREIILFPWLEAAR